MTQVIDRRQNSGKKSTVNRQRFLARYKKQIKEAVNNQAKNREIQNIAQGEQISISTKDLSEPQFGSGHGGIKEQILPGNDVFAQGDTIKRPDSSQDASGGCGEGKEEQPTEDPFAFELTREEFLDLYFEDLALPDMVKKELTKINTTKTIRAGVTLHGTPTNINVRKSLRHACGRRMALAASAKKRLREAELQLSALTQKEPCDKTTIHQIQVEIDALNKKIKAVPFIDTFDLRYNHRIRVSSPSTQAVMFCIMDVSGSMDEQKKEIAKRFFILLYLFLNKNYAKIELVFIRHHTSAKEVSEHDFFYSRETGGTVVSSALELLKNCIDTQYPPTSWNIYVAQASDGDNWNADSPYCLALLNEHIMPLLQYFAYIEILPRHHQSLWSAYETLKQNHPQFAMESIEQLSDIYPVFRQLFQRKTG